MNPWLLLWLPHEVGRKFFDLSDKTVAAALGTAARRRTRGVVTRAARPDRRDYRGDPCGGARLRAPARGIVRRGGAGGGGGGAGPVRRARAAPAPGAPRSWHRPPR